MVLAAQAPNFKAMDDGRGEKGKEVLLPADNSSKGRSIGNFKSNFSNSLSPLFVCRERRKISVLCPSLAISRLDEGFQWMDGWMDEWMWSPPSLSLPPSPRTHGERMCQSLLQYSRPKRLTPSNFHTCLPSHPERAYLASDSLWWQAIILIRNHSQECN